MKNRAFLLLAFCLAIIWFCGFSRTQAQDSSIQAKLVGKWSQQMAGATTGGAVMNITSIDSATGQLKGKWIPPSGPAGGKDFDIIGWVSSAPPRPNLDNVIVLSFSVSLNTYGSIANWTGYLKDNKIIASWYNVRPNSGYEWDHVITGQDFFSRIP